MIWTLQVITCISQGIVMTVLVKKNECIRNWFKKFKVSVLTEWYDMCKMEAVNQEQVEVTGFTKICDVKVHFIHKN